MTPCEVELLTRYLTHLNILCEDADFADFEEWYQPVRYAKGPGAPRTVEEASGAALQGRAENSAGRQARQPPLEPTPEESPLNQVTEVLRPTAATALIMLALALPACAGVPPAAQVPTEIPPAATTARPTSPSPQPEQASTELPADTLEPTQTSQMTPAPPPAHGPSEGFASVSAGLDHTCGIRTDGSVACWGANRYGESIPPPSELALVSAGAGYTCGLTTDGSLTCWGADDRGQSTPPRGSFVAVSAGNPGACGLRKTGGVTCWGDSRLGQDAIPQGEFAQVSAGAGYACGVRTDGSAACWGDNRLSRATPVDRGYAAARAGTDSLGDPYACGIRTEGWVECWGKGQDSGDATPTGTFVSISAGAGYACGVTDQGLLACWGQERSGRTTPPRGKFTSVSAGGLHACGVRIDGSVRLLGRQPPRAGHAGVIFGLKLSQCYRLALNHP